MKPAAPGLWLAPGVDLEQGRSWQQGFGQWFEAASPELPPQHAGRLAILDSPLGKLVAKRDPKRGLKRWLVWCGLREAHGQRAFRVGCAMRAAGVPCAEPLAYVQVRGKAPHVDGVLVSHFVQATDPWGHLEQQREPLAELGALLQALAKSIAALHLAGFRHRDLKAPNLLVSAEEVHGQLEVRFIDLEAARGPQAVSTKQATRDLARLCASFLSPRAAALGIERSHWELLLTAYMKRAEVSPIDYASMLRATLAWAREHNARNDARGRPVT